MVCNTQLAQHLGTGGDHHGRTAEVEFHGREIRLMFDVVQDDFVDIAGGTVPLVFFEGRGQGYLEIEVRVFGGQRFEVLAVVDFLPRRWRRSKYREGAPTNCPRARWSTQQRRSARQTKLPCRGARGHPGVRGASASPRVGLGTGTNPPRRGRVRWPASHSLRSNCSRVILEGGLGWHHLLRESFRSYGIPV